MAPGARARSRARCPRAPTTRQLRAALRYCEGHLHRIDGEARKARRLNAEAQHEFAEAVAAFREAAELAPNWPDPFLGLARTFIYGLDDVDRGADALKQAQRAGYTPGERETAQLARRLSRARRHAWRAARGQLEGHAAGARLSDARRRGVPAGARPTTRRRRRITPERAARTSRLGAARASNTRSSARLAAELVARQLDSTATPTRGCSRGT